MLYEPYSYPQRHIQWFDQTAQWLAHFPELPQTRFVTDQVFHMIHEFRDHRPHLWAWTLDNIDSPDIRFEQQYIHNTFMDQLSIVKLALTSIAQILARNRELQLLISPDHGIPDWRRPIVHGFAGCLLRWLPQAEDRPVIRWSSQEELQFLCQHLGWLRLPLMVARLTLRQEDTLNQLGLDTSLMMFLQCGRGSIMPTLLVFGRITL